jgi:hypothetical protein
VSVDARVVDRTRDVKTALKKLKSPRGLRQRAFNKTWLRGQDLNL